MLSDESREEFGPELSQIFLVCRLYQMKVFLSISEQITANIYTVKK